MIGVDGVGDDVLARVEGVGAFGPQWLGGIAVREGFGSGGANFERGEIFDGAGPGEFGVVEGGVAVNGGGEPGDWRDEKDEVPEGGG